MGPPNQSKLSDSYRHVLEQGKGSDLEGNLSPDISNGILFLLCFLFLESMVVCFVLANPATNSSGVREASLSIGPMVLMDPNMDEPLIGPSASSPRMRMSSIIACTTAFLASFLYQPPSTIQSPYLYITKDF